jgi:hypothetical protein
MSRDDRLLSTVQKKAANFLIENQITTSYLAYESATPIIFHLTL